MTTLERHSYARDRINRLWRDHLISSDMGTDVRLVGEGAGRFGDGRVTNTRSRVSCSWNVMRCSNKARMSVSWLFSSL